MGKKKKDTLVAFEILSPDTLHEHTERICRNFICFKSNLRECLGSEIRKKEYEKDATVQREFDTITGYQTDARDGIGNLGTDLVSVLPVEFGKSVKPSTPYIYRTRCYSNSKSEDAYGTKEDAIQTIVKKIKTRRAVMNYNGVTERFEFDADRVKTVFDDIEEDTVEFDISQIGRNGMEGDIILVTIFKNDMKI